jgi:hypothetical protein
VPVIGSVTDVEMYTFQGVVACVTPIGALVIDTGTVVDVTTYAWMGCGNEVTETEPLIGSVVLVET